MKLIRFRVTNFRSVDDSGWIEVDSVTALIGTNESGKTNLLIPLWKLNPAKDGEINPLSDFPRNRYNEIRVMNSKPIFIEAHFELPDSLAVKIAEMTGATVEDVRIALVQRSLGGTYYIDFPYVSPQRHVVKSGVIEILSKAHFEINVLTASKTEEKLKSEILSALKEAINEVEAASNNVDRVMLEKIMARLDAVESQNSLKRSTVVPRFEQVLDAITEMLDSITKLAPAEYEQVRTLVRENLPSFVYYSNYGNLDSEIYLPHVIDHMRRTNLGSREQAKVRTLKVLFEFVKLNPQEILELGQGVPTNQGQPTEEQIKAVAEKTKERSILLQSAGTDLTQKFRSWWKQGEYRFRFQADGDHFRIWVSDDKRPEEIELEGRSTGLQWFLSFYLIFLVERADSHQDAILLLDEPGLSLHPLAQRDLSEFFENLAQTNQLMYTTHSPFLVDPDHLDRVKAVYVNDNGTTSVSANLRANESNLAQSKSIYPVYAALGLSASDTLLLGCQLIVVEGASDQHYLSAIKNYLISRGLITPKREIQFIPAGGIKGVNAVAPILSSNNGELPHIILDSDSSGQGLAKQLKSNLYSGAANRIIMVGDFCKLPSAEVEDLFPSNFLAKIITRYLRGPEDDFLDVVVEGEPIVSQVQKYAQKYNLTLEPGWKVEVAKQTKIRLLQRQEQLKSYEDAVEMWKVLFLALEP